MAAEGGLKLLGLTVSPFVIRVRMALQMKGIGYEYMEQDLFTKGELLRKSNPVHMKVPVLIHGGKPICESLAIVQYVDEVWAATGPSILPADPYDLTAARFWAATPTASSACVGRHHVGADGRGEGGEGRQHARGYRPVGGGVPQVLEGKGLLRRRFRRVPRSRRRLAVALVRGAAEDVRRRGH